MGFEAGRNSGDINSKLPKGPRPNFLRVEGLPNEERVIWFSFGPTLKEPRDISACTEVQTRSGLLHSTTLQGPGHGQNDRIGSNKRRRIP